MTKDKKEETDKEAALEDDTPYPYYVFFILGNEFCERYAYYGMRSILVIYLSYFLGYDKDTATIIYHTFAALCYFFPLIGGIIADSYWGKFRTIWILSVIYLIGMVLISLSSIPQLNNGLDVPGTINDILALVALLVVAIGTGGIKPCVSALGGDQFKDNEKGQQQLSGFFSLFYASINAGSLLSTFISPILRETSCFNRADCYFIAFIVPAGLMFVAIGAFVLGRSYYVMKKPSGNVFAEFMKATWNGLRNKCKSNEKKEHFLDHCDTTKFEQTRLNEFKFIYPLMVMYLPLPFFWALFDMQGSRFVLSATQMDGWVGPVKIKPDQMQIMNPVMILLFLPLFQYGVYPLIEKCGIKMTSLRRMSVGQIITAISFMVAGFVQLTIDDGLTNIPDYGTQNSMMVINGHYDTQLTVQSAYWEDIEYNIDDTTDFTLEGETKRTPTSAWIRDDFPAADTKLTINDIDYTINANNDADFSVEELQVTSVLCYMKDNEEICEQYFSPTAKSGSIRVRAVLLNPTNYFANFRLMDIDNTDAKDLMTNDTVVSPYTNSINDNTEFERGVYKIQVRLWESEPDDLDNPSINPIISCETPDFIQNEGDPTNPDSFIFGAGSIWTFMVTTDNVNTCKISYDEDSNANSVNIFLLVPQYVVITVGEVMNSVTGLEFSYTQSPKSLKSVVQSFWLLTVCVGNIIDVFFVEIKLAPTQSGEYFALSGIMLGASMIFVLLSYFYYEYVPEGLFLDKEETPAEDSPKEDTPEEEKAIDETDIGVENVALEQDALDKKSETEEKAELGEESF